MSEVIIYHNARCSKSRCALSYLEEGNVDSEIRNYLKDAPSISELKELLKKLGMKPEELVRKNERIYKENFADKEYSEDEWLEILHNNPRLIERPIIVKGDKAIIGRPPEKVNEFLGLSNL